MGVYDKMEFHLECRNCGAKEQIVFLDQGVGWGFPEWVVTGAVTLFDAALTDGEVTKPRVEVKSCKVCGGSDVASHIE